MLRKYLLGLATFVIAFAILSVSVLESASVRYAFATPSPIFSSVLGEKKEVVIDYQLPYPGRIMPDNPFWTLKAIRDKIWLFLTGNLSKKAELALLFSDKRLGMSKTLFERQKPELAFSTLSKGEKYLEEAVLLEKKAREKGDDTSAILTKIAMASLKHRLTIDEILTIAPEDAKPEILKIQDYSKNAFKEARDGLNSKGITSPINPFDGDK